ncbi:M6 family metalloprotease domain-containing protein [bacterium]|nr:M6 family metalloprotease domain-containing protein [bacterium]
MIIHGKTASALVLWSMLAVTPQAMQAAPSTQDGPYRYDVWTTINDDTSRFNHGDPGWVRHMAQRRSRRAAAARGGTQLQAITPDKFNLPVLLGCFSDKKGFYSANNFQSMLFNDQNPDGSLSNYYSETSYGQFQLTGNCYGWFNVDNPQSYYAAHDNGKSDNFPNNRPGFVRDVVAKADPSLDFSQFDNDGPDGVPNSGDDDGYVDCVYVVFVGKGAEGQSSGDTTNLWSSQGSLWNNEYTTNDVSANGRYVKINTWVLVAEMEYYKYKNGYWMEGIGTFAHEFGHVLGLPDLYDRTDASVEPDYTSSRGIGSWCLMAGGSWSGELNYPDKPSQMSAWCKIKLGWVTPTIIDRNQNLTIQQVETSPQIFQLWEDEYASSRYFLLENRQKTELDQHLAGDGLLIYHVDDYHWNGLHNTYGPDNDDVRHKMVDIEEADGKDDLDKAANWGDAGDPFPGSSGAVSFDDGTYPNSRDYDGNATGVAVRNISSSGPFMTADVSVRQLTGCTLAYDEAGISGWSWGYQNPLDTWGGVLFTCSETGLLQALDIAFKADNTSYRIEVYRTFSNLTPGGLLCSTEGIAARSGWNRIVLDSPPVLRENQDFFVSLKIHNAAYAIPYDKFGEKSLRSFISGDGVNFDGVIGRMGGDINMRALIRTRGVQPVIALSDTVLSLGCAVRGKNALKTLTVSNTGKLDLDVSRITCDSAVFSVDRSAALIPAGDSVLLTVRFSPTAVGKCGAILSLLSNAPDRDSLNVKLTGECTVSNISLSKNSLAFGEVCIDSLKTCLLEVFNRGAAAFDVHSVTSGDSAFQASLSDSVLSPGGKMVLSVSFSPRKLVQYSGAVSLVSNDTTLTVTLSGVGKKPPVFLSALGNEYFRETEGYYQVWVILSNALSNPAVSLLLSEDGGKTFSTRIPCSRVGDRYFGAVPAQPLGTVLCYYAEASDSTGAVYTLPPDAPESCFRLEVTQHKRGDTDDNWKVDVFDLLALLKQLSDPSKQTSQGDVNSDGRIDVFDLLALLKILNGN